MHYSQNSNLMYLFLWFKKFDDPIALTMSLNVSDQGQLTSAWYLVSLSFVLRV